MIGKVRKRTNKLHSLKKIREQKTTTAFQINLITLDKSCNFLLEAIANDLTLKYKKFYGTCRLFTKKRKQIKLEYRRLELLKDIVATELEELTDWLKCQAVDVNEMIIDGIVDGISYEPLLCQLSSEHDPELSTISNVLLFGNLGEKHNLLQ